MQHLKTNLKLNISGLDSEMFFSKTYWNTEVEKHLFEGES